MRFNESVNNSKLILTVLISALAHFIVISAVNLPPSPKSPTEMSVSFFEPPPQIKIPEPKIVSTPDLAQTDQPNPNAKLKSDISANAEKESVKRGDNGGAPGDKTPATPATKSAQNKNFNSEPKQLENQSETKFKQNQKKPLLLRDENLLAKYAIKPKEQKTDSNQTTQQITKEFSRAPGSGAAFYGTEGVPDYLPELPDGDLTLLNTKAFQYAVFVQRVAIRVFGEMRQAGWELLRAADIAAISDSAVVDAVIDKSGNLVSVAVKKSSGSSRFDGVLREAVRKGVTDRNPPQSAAQNDGNIHFEFHSRSWVRPIISPHGAPSEQRWLLLGTGLR